jgi:hypothetical protein
MFEMSVKENKSMLDILTCGFIREPEAKNGAQWSFQYLRSLERSERKLYMQSHGFNEPKKVNARLSFRI